MNRVKLLLLPSVSSSALSLIVAGLLCGGAIWSHINNSQLFYDYIFGVYGFKTQLLLASDTYNVIQRSILNGPLTYHLLVFGAALLAGVTTYAVLETTRHAVNNTNELLREVHRKGLMHQRFMSETIARLVLRTFSVVGWVIYWVFFIDVIWPYGVILCESGLDKLNVMNNGGWLPMLAAYLLLAVAVHIHVIFARLFLLRPRVFGDREIEELSALEHHANNE